MSSFTICALLYGDHFSLAQRCLEPLFKLSASGAVELRIGMNEVCIQTKEYVAANNDSADIVTEANPQVYKYPMMRRLFNEKPITSDYVMWFDDDSYIKDTDLSFWLRSVSSQMTSCDMLGSVYVIPYGNDQKSWCRTQPWYKGKPIPDKPKFATGGWWCIKTEVIKRFDWPTVNLKHCGGDVALGVLLEQNNLTLRHFKDGVAVNADDSGKESAAPRRGASRTEKPIGKGFVGPSL